MQIRLILVAAASLIPQTSIASEWWVLGENSTSFVFVDVETLLRTGSEVRFWDYTIYKNKNSEVGSQKSRENVDCLRRTLTSGALVSYHRNGNVGSQVLEGSRIDVPPDTAGDVMLKFACGTTAYRKQIAFKLDITPEQFFENSTRMNDVESVPPH